MFFLALLLTSCEEEKVDTSKIIFDPVFAKNLLTKSNDTIQIDAELYTLEVLLNRDFMPPVPKDGAPLTSMNCLASMDGDSIPTTIDLVKQYVINNDSIWISLYEKENPENGNTASKLCKISIEGPQWNPGILVDVVVEIYDSKNDSIIFISASDQIINSTY